MSGMIETTVPYRRGGDGRESFGGWKVQGIQRARAIARSADPSQSNQRDQIQQSNYCQM